VLCRIFFVAAYRIRHGGRHWIPETGGVLVLSSHQSHLDPILVGMGFNRRLNYLARDTLFGFAPFRWLINSLDAIPIDREGLGLDGLKETLRRLKRGEMVLMFPEGTRTVDGNVGRLKPGFCALAKRGNAYLLPVAVVGAFEAWPRSQSFPRLGHIHVEFGPPLAPEQMTGLDEAQLVAEIDRRIRRCHEAAVRARARGYR